MSHPLHSAIEETQAKIAQAADRGEDTRSLQEELSYLERSAQNLQQAND